MERAMVEPVPSDDPQIASLNALLERLCRPILIEHLAIPGGGEDVPDPEAARATISIAEDAPTGGAFHAGPVDVPSRRTIIVTWPESMHSDAPSEALKAAVIAALPAELRGYPVLIT
jgi:hypothetical protein